jgi:hypothetical protein
MSFAVQILTVFLDGLHILTEFKTTGDFLEEIVKNRSSKNFITNSFSKTSGSAKLSFQTNSFCLSSDIILTFFSTSLRNFS